MDYNDYIVPVVLVAIVAIVVALLIRSAQVKRRKLEAMSPEERSAFLAERAAKAQAAQIRRDQVNFGPINPAMVCPHCSARGYIRTKGITTKKGVSGGKATAAVLTGGVSLLAVGLSRKENSTQAHCCNCRNTWVF